MTIYELADIIDKAIIITYYPNQEGRFSAKFEHAEVMEGGCLASIYGDGKYPDEAIENYLKKVRGKKLAFNAFTKYRTEFVVPDSTKAF